MLDGEIVAFDETGRPSFQQLQHRTAKATAIRYFAFDLLHLNGMDLQAESLTAGGRRCRSSLPAPDMEFSDELAGTADQVVEAVTQVGLEGVIAKRRDSRYEPGKRSGAWQKFKLQHRQEFVIGGYKPENNNFQSIVVGYYEDKTAALRRAACGPGFTAAQRAALFEVLRPLQVEKCPFADLPTGKTGHWGEGVTEEDMKVAEMGEARARGGDGVHRMDTRRAPSSFRIRRNPRTTKVPATCDANAKRGRARPLFAGCQRPGG